VRSYLQPSGQGLFRREIAVGETLPQKAIVLFMSEKRHNGDWELNKLKFDPCGASSVLMKCNQKHLPYINGYTADWVKDLFQEVYAGVTRELGVRHSTKLHEFDDGFCIFGFDLTANKTGNIVLAKPNRGSLELEVKFSPDPTENLMVVIVLIYAGRFSITKSGMYVPG
jgi:hypothetical protein